MPKQRNSRRYRKSSSRRVWVFSELNHDLRPEQLARIITAAGLEQARREADAATPAAPNEVTDVSVDVADGDSSNRGAEDSHA